MVHRDFWDVMRDLRATLTDAGEHDWSARLHTALATSTRRDGLTSVLVDCLRELRAGEVTPRLGLTELLDRVLADVDEARASAPITSPGPEGGRRPGGTGFARPPR